MDLNKFNKDFEINSGGKDSKTVEGSENNSDGSAKTGGDSDSQSNLNSDQDKDEEDTPVQI